MPELAVPAQPAHPNTPIAHVNTHQPFGSLQNGSAQRTLAFHDIAQFPGPFGCVTNWPEGCLGLDEPHCSRYGRSKRLSAIASSFRLRTFSCPIRNRR